MSDNVRNANARNLNIASNTDEYIFGEQVYFKAYDIILGTSHYFIP